MHVKNTDEALKRVIGVTGLAATIVNNTIGAGIYVLPAIVSAQMGASGIVAYFFCAAMLVAIMLCYMEIGSKTAESGGSYAYVENAFGPFAGFIVNWLFFFGWGVLGSAALINLVADSASSLFPIFQKPFLRALLFFLLLGSMALLNVRGAKESVKFLQYVTIAKIIPLLAIVVFGFSHVKMVNLVWTHQPSINTTGQCVLSLFFAFAGFETSLGASGEIKDTKRTVPRAVILGGLVVFIFYLLIQTISQGVLGTAMSTSLYKDAPLAAVASEIVGPIGATILLIATIISCLGNTSGDILATPRLLFAGANDGIFPKFLGKVHPKFATPYVSVLVYTGMIFLFAVFGGFNQLAVLASGALLLIYLGVVLAMLKLRKTGQPVAEKTFRVPGGVIVPFIGIVAIIWLLTNLKVKEMIGTVVFVAAICVIYFVMRWFKGVPVSNQ